MHVLRDKHAARRRRLLKKAVRKTKPRLTRLNGARKMS